MSNNGLITKIWGPGGWTFMHSITFGYPVEPTNEQKKQYKQFFESVGDVLPCSYCRDSYKKFISNGKTESKTLQEKRVDLNLQTALTDDVMENRESLTKWLYYLHEAVNKKLDVDYGVSYDDVCQRYESFRAICESPNDTKAIGCLMPLDKKAQSYKVASNIDCPIIFPNIAREFINYARLRGIDNEEIELIGKLEGNVQSKNRDVDIWCLRNKECKEIIFNMRNEGTPSLEPKGSEWAGLPTVEELKLMMRLSSNLSNNKLSSLICKLQSGINTDAPKVNIDCKKFGRNKKTYRLVRR